MECAYYFALLNGIGGKRWNRRAGETEGGGGRSGFRWNRFSEFSSKKSGGEILKVQLRLVECCD